MNISRVAELVLSGVGKVVVMRMRGVEALAGATYGRGSERAEGEEGDLEEFHCG